MTYRRLLTLTLVLFTATMLSACVTHSTPAPHKSVAAKVKSTTSFLPNVAGETIENASSLLTSFGFKVALIDQTGAASTITDGSVKSQSPESATDVQNGSTITLVVIPTPTFPVPNVVGMTQSAATTTLNTANFEGVFTPSYESNDWLVSAQAPVAGTLEKADAKIALTLVAPPPPMVVYTVTGNGSRASSITYSTGGVNQQQATNARLPWSFTMPESGELGYVILAQDGNGTSITCTITVGDQVVSQNTSTGSYAIATCQGG